MLRPTRLLLVCSLLTLCTLSLALGQEVGKDPSNKTQIITASVTPDGVRIAAPNTVVQLRLEVYDDAGQKLFDTEQRGGNVIDWHLQGGAGDRVADGTYLCVVTIKNPTGRLSRKLGLATVNAQSTTLRPAGVAELSLLQAQVVGPTEGDDEGLAVVPAEDAQPVTVLAQTGDQAQLTRTRGPLGFRVGDFFGGRDKEQMRLTEEGNLGIGTAKPKVKLDVAGMIRAREGFLFSNGSSLNVNDKGALTLTSSDGSVTPNVVGTGTQNRITKWTDNAGTVGDSLLNETSLGIELRPASPGVGVNGSLVNPSNVPGFAAFHFYPASGPNANMSFSVIPRGTGAPNNHAQFSIFGTDLLADPNNYEFAGMRARDTDFVLGSGRSGTGQIRPFMLASGFLSDNVTNNGQLFLAPNGNVGVGTTNPTAKLDVAGNVRLNGAGNGITFPDGTKMTTAGGGSGSMTGTSIVSAVNDAATTGTINDNRLSPNVARLNSTNTFTGNQTVNGAVQSTSGGFIFPDGSTQTGAAGQGFTKSASTDLEISPGSGSEIISVDFPAGTYLLTASIQFENTANLLFQNNSRLVSCIFSHPISQNEPGWQVRLGAPGNEADQVPLTFTGVYTDTQPWHVRLFCQVLNGGIDRSYVLVKGRRLTAVRLGNLVTQP